MYGAILQIAHTRIDPKWYVFTLARALSMCASTFHRHNTYFFGGFDDFMFACVSVSLSVSQYMKKVRSIYVCLNCEYRNGEYETELEQKQCCYLYVSKYSHMRKHTLKLLNRVSIVRRVLSSLIFGN